MKRAKRTSIRCNYYTTTTQGRGNVFADLGLADPEWHGVKARVASKIFDAIQARDRTRSQAATELGLSQADVSRIIRGIPKDCPVDHLMRLLVKLGYHVSVYVEGDDQAPERIVVSRP